MKYDHRPFQIKSKCPLLSSLVWVGITPLGGYYLVSKFPLFSSFGCIILLSWHNQSGATCSNLDFKDWGGILLILFVFLTCKDRASLFLQFYTHILAVINARITLLSLSYLFMAPASQPS